MEEVWRQGRTNVRAVMEALNKKRRKDRAYTTYMTIMARLARKGLLHREREGRTDAYWPRFTREEFLRSRAQQEVSTLVSEFGEVALVLHRYDNVVVGYGPVNSFPRKPSTFLLSEVEKGEGGLGCGAAKNGHKTKSCLAPKAKSTSRGGSKS